MINNTIKLQSRLKSQSSLLKPNSALILFKLLIITCKSSAAIEAILIILFVLVVKHGLRIEMVLSSFLHLCIVASLPVS